LRSRSRRSGGKSMKTSSAIPTPASGLSATPRIPALADAALQVAKAPFKLTVAATRKTGGLIGRGLRL
jgi:hypothetical protein